MTVTASLPPFRGLERAPLAQHSLVSIRENQESNSPALDVPISRTQMVPRGTTLPNPEHDVISIRMVTTTAKPRSSFPPRPTSNPRPARRLRLDSPTPRTRAENAERSDKVPPQKQRRLSPNNDNASRAAPPSSAAVQWPPVYQTTPTIPDDLLCGHLRRRGEQL